MAMTGSVVPAGSTDTICCVATPYRCIADAMTADGLQEIFCGGQALVAVLEKCCELVSTHPGRFPGRSLPIKFFGQGHGAF